MRGYVRPDAISVPQKAVSESPQGAFVYVIKEDNSVELRLIEPGDWSGSDWIIESGLAKGDKVVVDGLIKVQPGITVVPSPLEAAASDAKTQ